MDVFFIISEIDSVVRRLGLALSGGRKGTCQMYPMKPAAAGGKRQLLDISKSTLFDRQVSHTWGKCCTVDRLMTVFNLSALGQSSVKDGIVSLGVGSKAIQTFHGF